MYRKIKRLFIIAKVSTVVLILLSMIAAVVRFVRGDVFYGCLSIATAIAYIILIFWSKNKLSPFYHMVNEYEKMEDASINMTAEEFLELDDEDLVITISMRITKEADCDEPTQCLEILNEEQKVFYIVTYFKEEIENGGLCQFFVNSSRVVAPFVSESLSVIGAEKYRKMYDDFVNENAIDLTDLSSFETEDEKEFEHQYERYDFEKFDEGFGELNETEPLDKFIAKYAREHIEQLVGK